MKWVIDGARKMDGKLLSVEVEAENENAAVASAASMGILVAEVKLVDRGSVGGFLALRAATILLVLSACSCWAYSLIALASAAESPTETAKLTVNVAFVAGSFFFGLAAICDGLRRIAGKVCNG